MKTVLVTLMMLPAAGVAGAQHTPPAQSLRAAYLLHIGESDKPLRPFVLALETPQPSDLAGVFREPIWRHADIFIVPPQMLAAVAHLVRDGSVDAPISPAFGSFQITLVTAQTRNRVVLPPEQSKQVFQDILMHLDPSQATLRDYLKNLLQRLGVASSGGS